jgi:hypothetical protein
MPTETTPVKRLLRPETAFFLIVWLVCLLGYRERGFYDPGALWHIKVGERILDTGLPRSDPFTYTFEGRPWVPMQWAAEAVMALGHRAGGLDTLLLAFATVVATLFTLIFRRATQSGMGPLLAGLVVGGALFVGAFHFLVRPHMLTVALLGWTMMCLVDFDRGRCGLGRLAGLIPVYALWTNLHGGVLGGMATVLLTVAGWGVVFLIRRPNPPAPFPEKEGGEDPAQGTESSSPQGRGVGEGSWLHTPVHNWRTLFVLAAIAVTCVLTAFVNPFGLQLIRTWQSIVGSKVLHDVVSEHLPLDPASPIGQAVMCLGAFYVFMLAGLLSRGETPTGLRASWLIPLVWLVLSFKGIRHGPLFAVSAVVAVVDFWPYTLWYRLLRKHGDGSLARDPEPVGGAAATRSGARFAWAVIPALAILVAFALQVNRVPVPVVGSGWARLNPECIPSDLTDEVRAYAASVPPGTRIWNDANLGGYLIYHAPTLKIFMDDRCELYGDDWMRAYTDALVLPPEELGPVFETWADHYQFERALVMTEPADKEKPPLERYLLSVPRKWREVARGKRAVMFERVR